MIIFRLWLIKVFKNVIEMYRVQLSTSYRKAYQLIILVIGRKLIIVGKWLLNLTFIVIAF